MKEEPTTDGQHVRQKDGITLISAERQRQLSVEGWTPEHDDTHDHGDLASAAAVYATPMGLRRHYRILSKLWPWEMEWYKPTPLDRVRELEKAGALIAAEIDRLQRQSSSVQDGNEVEVGSPIIPKSESVSSVVVTEEKNEDSGLKEPASDHVDAVLQKALPAIPLPGDILLRNGGVDCDMLNGPCSCGAWHHVSDLAWRLEHQRRPNDGLIATCSCSHTNLDHTEDGCEVSGCGCSGFDFKFWGASSVHDGNESRESSPIIPKSESAVVVTEIAEELALDCTNSIYNNRHVTGINKDNYNRDAVKTIISDIILSALTRVCLDKDKEIRGLKAELNEMVKVLTEHDEWHQSIGEVSLFRKEDGAWDDIGTNLSLEYDESSLREKTENALASARASLE